MASILQRSSCRSGDGDSSGVTEIIPGPWPPGQHPQRAAGHVGVIGLDGQLHDDHLFAVSASAPTMRRAAQRGHRRSARDCSGDPGRTSAPPACLVRIVRFRSGTLSQFGQSGYVPGGNPASISMGQTGLLCTPASGAGGTPRKLIVALHGCLTNQELIGDTFADDPYLNQYAATSNPVVLYPQALVLRWCRSARRRAGTGTATPAPGTRSTAPRKWSSS